MLNGNSLLRALQRCPSTKLRAGHWLEEGKRHCQNSVIVPYRGSTCASAASVWGSQNVMSMARYSARAATRAARAGSRWPVVAYSMPRLQWQCAPYFYSTVR